MGFGLGLVHFVNKGKYIYIMEIFGKYNMAQNLGSFRKSAILRPFGGKFRKVFNTKVVRVGKMSPTEVESMQSEFVWNF